MAEDLLSTAAAFKRFLPGVKDIAARTMTRSRLDQYKAGVVEGDLVVEREGLVLTSEMVPAFQDAPLGALFITGSLRAPNATIAEPDIDWSPLLKIEYLAIGYTDLSRSQLARLYDGLPRAFISCQYVDGKSDFDFPEYERLSAVDNHSRQRRFAQALAELDDMAAARNLRRALLPLELHAKLLTLPLQVRRVAAEEEQDRGRREAMAEAAFDMGGSRAFHPARECRGLLVSRLSQALAGAAQMPLCPRHRPRTPRRSRRRRRAPRSILRKASSTASCSPSTRTGTATRAPPSASSASGCPARGCPCTPAIRPRLVRLGQAVRFRRGWKGYRLTEP